MVHDITAEQPLQLSIPRNRAWFLGFAVVLFLLAGCATGGKVEPEHKPEAVAEAAALEQGPSVSRLEDGREGFVIQERPRMDAESRNRFEMAVGLLQEEDYAQAAELLERVVEGSPEVTAPYINLALAYLRLDRLEEAEEQLQTALTLFPGHPAAGNAYGLLLRRSGRFDEARTVYEQTLASFPEYLPARRNFGILCDLYLNDPACALEQYGIYSESMPGDEQVELWIADLRLRLGR